MKATLRLSIGALGLAVFNVSAQIEAEIGVQTYAGLTITGAIGQVYSVEYVTDLIEQTESDWRCLEFLQLPASPYLWADKSVPAIGKRFYRAVAMGPLENMVFIPPGTFRMGSPDDEEGRWDDEGPRTAVIISRGFWMGQHEVTQAEYLSIAGTNPSHFTGDDSRPVEQVTWHEAVAYCSTRTEHDRMAGRIPRGSSYRLPTEAEWEYAYRGWTSTRLSYGDDPGYTKLTDYAWYFVNSGGSTHPVGQKLPNPWGLYDMAGNVAEWLQDWWSDRLPGGVVVDPQGPSTGSYRAHRGCNWFNTLDNARYCRCALRNCIEPGYRGNGIGFRVILVAGQP